MPTTSPETAPHPTSPEKKAPFNVEPLELDNVEKLRQTQQEAVEAATKDIDPFNVSRRKQLAKEVMDGFEASGVYDSYLRDYGVDQDDPNYDLYVSYLKDFSIQAFKGSQQGGNWVVAPKDDNGNRPPSGRDQLRTRLEQIKAEFTTEEPETEPPKDEEPPKPDDEPKPSREAIEHKTVDQLNEIFDGLTPEQVKKLDRLNEWYSARMQREINNALHDLSDDDVEAAKKEGESFDDAKQRLATEKATEVCRDALEPEVDTLMADFADGVDPSDPRYKEIRNALLLIATLEPGEARDKIILLDVVAQRPQRAGEFDDDAKKDIEKSQVGLLAIRSKYAALLAKNSKKIFEKEDLQQEIAEVRSQLTNEIYEAASWLAAELENAGVEQSAIEQEVKIFIDDQLDSVVGEMEATRAAEIEDRRPLTKRFLNRWAKWGGGGNEKLFSKKRFVGNLKKGGVLSIVGVPVGVAAGFAAAPLVGGLVAAGLVGAAGVGLVRSAAKGLAGARLDQAADVTVAQQQAEDIIGRMNDMESDITRGNDAAYEALARAESMPANTDAEKAARLNAMKAAANQLSTHDQLLYLMAERTDVYRRRNRNRILGTTAVAGAAGLLTAGLVSGGSWLAGTGLGESVGDRIGDAWDNIRGRGGSSLPGNSANWAEPGVIKENEKIWPYLSDVDNSNGDVNGAGDQSVGNERNDHGFEHDYSRASERIKAGEGWYQTFKELGVPAKDRDELLAKVGPKLVDQGIAYKDPEIGGYGIYMTENGKMPTKALDAIVETAHQMNIDVDTNLDGVVDHEVSAGSDISVENGVDTGVENNNGSTPDTAPQEATHSARIAEQNAASDAADASTQEGTTAQDTPGSRGGARPEADRVDFGATENVPQSIGQLVEQGELNLTSEGSNYVDAQAAIEKNSGWASVLREKGIDQKHWNNLLQQAGDSLYNVQYPDGQRAAEYNQLTRQWEIYTPTNEGIPAEVSRIIDSIAERAKWTI